MTRVFICYSRHDIDFVDQMVADLDAMGIDTWRDVDDIPDNVASNTTSWRRAVSEGLRTADAMIVVLSPDAVASQEVEAEWNYHLARQKPLYPVLYRETEFPYRLMSLQIWDLRSDYRPTLQRLAATIQSGVAQGGRRIKPGEGSARRRRPLGAIALAAVAIIIAAVLAMSGALSDIIGSSPTPTEEKATSSGQEPVSNPAETLRANTPEPEPSQAGPTQPADTGPAEDAPTPTEVALGDAREAAIAFTQGDLNGSEIALIDEQGRNLRILTDNAFYDGEPDISPDGARIAYESLEFGNYDIFVIDSDGQNPRRLTNFNISERHPDWSADGELIAYEVGASSDADIYVMRGDGTGQAQITDTTWGDRAPQFSPDGAQIAFMTRQTGQWQIALIGYPIAGEPRLFECPADSCRFPVWSPDGTQLAYNTLDESGSPAEVYTLDVASGESTLIVPGANYGRPTWAGDGLAIFFNFTRESNTDVYRYDVQTGRIERITTTTANEYGPDWGLLP